jgi:hypothetical protein
MRTLARFNMRVFPLKLGVATTRVAYARSSSMKAASNEIGARSTGAAYPLPLRDGLEDNLRFDLVAAVEAMARVLHRCVPDQHIPHLQQSRRPKPVIS